MIRLVSQPPYQQRWWWWEVWAVIYREIHQRASLNPDKHVDGCPPSKGQRQKSLDNVHRRLGSQSWWFLSYFTPLPVAQLTEAPLWK